MFLSKFATRNFSPKDAPKNAPKDAQKAPEDHSGHKKGQPHDHKKDPPHDSPKDSWPQKLVFAGEGMRILTHVGALKALDAKNLLHTVEQVSGSSMGSITALMVALKMTVAEIETALLAFDELHLQDQQPFGKLEIGYNLVRHKGLYQGFLFEQWIDNLVASKLGFPDATFADLQKYSSRQLNLLLTNVNRNSLEVFNVHTHPSERLASVLRAACNLGILYPPLAIPTTGDITHYDYADALMVTNYYISLWDQGEVPDVSVLGLLPAFVNEPSGPRVYPTDNLYSYLLASIETLITSKAQPMYWERTVILPCDDGEFQGIYSFLFTSLTMEQKTALIAAGEAATQKFLSTRAS